MKNARGFVAVSVCFIFLMTLVFVPSISYAQIEVAAGGTGAATGISAGTIAAIVVGAAVIAAGIAVASGGGGSGGLYPR